MNISLYNLSWYFLIYSFIGWAMATIRTSINSKKFVDVGFLYGPFCPVYGIGAVIFAIFLTELKKSLFFMFAGGIILSFVISIFTGLLLEKIFHRKWWDYSRKRFQFAGYINLPYTVVWGVAAVITICFLNPLWNQILSFLPTTIGRLILIILSTIMLLDLAGSVTGILSVHSRLRKINIVENTLDGLQKTSDIMGKGLAGWAHRHLAKAYPNLRAEELLKDKIEKEHQLEKEKAGVFAVGCSFYKLLCLFFLGAFLGDVTETVFCLITEKVLMSRSSVVYGPFSLVWGIGCVLLTAILYQYRNRSDRFIFLLGTVLGGAYEYVCSVFTELVFGTVFWDYSDIPFNLGGRINLLFCFFWGFAAVIWMKILYPKLSSLIEKIPKKIGIFLTWAMMIFMIFNIIVSALAMNRYSERNSGSVTPPPSNSVERILDEKFPDERMERIYPNAIIVK
ncbi:MAG: putative ABC transporter permease [Eubacterium sp.]|nr:putative ABC transporter permease [Eubacterium sp.]